VQTADQALAAARRIAEAVEETIAVRIDVDCREPRTTALVVALHRLVEAGPEACRAVDAAKVLDEKLGPLLAQAGPAGGRLRLWLAGRQRRELALAAVAEIRELSEKAAGNDVPLCPTGRTRSPSGRTVVVSASPRTTQQRLAARS
jgi:hypothetical protein